MNDSRRRDPADSERGNPPRWVGWLSVTAAPFLVALCAYLYWDLGSVILLVTLVQPLWIGAFGVWVLRRAGGTPENNEAL